MIRRLLLIGGALALLGTTACTRPPTSGTPTPVPAVTGPVTGGKLGIAFTSAPPEVLEPAGYREDEYLVGGTAVSYSPEGTLRADGRWALRAGASADYRTRVLVRRPRDAARFSGRVIVEWLNVSGGVDVDPDFGFTYPEVLGSGDAYVVVSAQKAGVDGAGLSLVPGVDVQPLVRWDPQRYGSLRHPGDQWSYDIFSQVGRALKQPATAATLLGGLAPRTVIAAGESQSAMRLFNYVNGVHPLARVYDGYLVHSRMAGGGFGSQNVSAARVRDDLDVPVLQFITETDLALFGAGRQPDTDRVRTWEVAGTAHADKALLAYQAASMARAFPGQDPGSALGCEDVNDGPQGYVARQALAALKGWAAGGPAPASGPPLQTTTGTTIARDARGIALGGIRTPAVDVPVATLSGQAAPGSSNGVFCMLFGSTTPFDAATLRTLYPTHEAYVARVAAAADAAVGAGFLRRPDAAEIIAAAAAAPVPPAP